MFHVYAEQLDFSFCIYEVLLFPLATRPFSLFCYIKIIKKFMQKYRLYVQDESKSLISWVATTLCNLYFHLNYMVGLGVGFEFQLNRIREETTRWLAGWPVEPGFAFINTSILWVSSIVRGKCWECANACGSC